jgi:hypothetical protein
MEVDLDISILELPFHLKKNEFHPIMLCPIHSFHPNQCMSFIDVKTFIHFQVNAPSLGSRLMDKPSSCNNHG